MKIISQRTYSIMNSNVLLLHYYNIFVKHFSLYDLENGNLFSLLILPDDLDKCT